MERNFRPEFLNRVDDIIVFRGLTQGRPEADHRHRAWARCRSGSRRRGLTLVLTDEAKELPDREGHQPGVRRPVRCAGPSSTCSKTRSPRNCCAAPSRARTPSRCASRRKTAKKSWRSMRLPRSRKSRSRRSPAPGDSEVKANFMAVSGAPLPHTPSPAFPMRVRGYGAEGRSRYVILNSALETRNTRRTRTKTYFRVLRVFRG